MKLPLIVVSYLPKKWQDKYIQKRWDKKSDEDIMVAFNDATEWVQLGRGSVAMPTIREIAQDCQDRLDKLIMPQVIKRGL